MRLYPGLRRRLLGTAWVLLLLALYGFKPSKGLFVLFFLRYITVGWLMQSASTLRDEQSSVAASFQKFFVPVLLELSRVPEVACLLLCNFASARRLLVVLWRLL